MRGDRLIQATARIIQDAVVGVRRRRGLRRPRRRRRLRGRRRPRDVAEEVAKRDLRALRRDRGRLLRARGPRARLRPDGGPQGRAAGHPARGRSRSASRAAARRAFAHYGEAVAVATEMKQFAKREPGLALRDRPPHRLTPAPRWPAPCRVPTVYWRFEQACFRGGVQFPTGGDSPRPRGSQPRVDPVELRDRP